MPDDSFTALAAQARTSLDEDSARLRGSLTYGLAQNPDQYAKDMATARKVGAPLDIVQDPKHRAAIEDMARRMNVSADDLLQRAPKTAGWLGSDPHNPSLAHDDLETLQKLEKIFAVPPEGPSRASSALGSWIAGSTRLAKGLTTDASRLGEAIFDRPLGALVEPFLPESLLATRRENIRKAEEARSGFDAAVFAPGQQMSKRMVNPEHWVINAVFGNLPDLAVAFATAGLGPAASAASKAPAGASLVSRIGTYLVNRAPMIAAQSATSFPSVLNAEADEYQHFNPNASRVEAVGKAAVSSAVQSVLEGLVEVPIIDKMRASKTLYQRLLGILGSSQVEGAEEVAQRLVSQALLPDPSGNRKLTAAELFDNWRGGVVAGGVFAGAAIKAPQPSGAEVFFEALATGATESKLLKRMPEKFQEAVAAMVKDGPIENVGIPAIQWATYWQSQGMTAEQAQSEAVAMGVQPEAYQQAMRLGDDIQVSTAAFATRIAPTEHYQGLAQDVRLVPGEQTQREAEASKAEQKARVEEILQTIKETPEDAGIAQIGQIQDEMKAQLEAAGRPAAEATAAAKGFAESIATLAVRNDMTVPDLLRMFQFTVKNGEALARPADGAILPVGGGDAQASDIRGRAGGDPEVGPVLGGGIAADGDGARAGRDPVPARNPAGTTPVGLGPLPPAVGFHGSKDRNLPANTLEVLKARTGSQLAQGIYITDDAGTAEFGGRKYAAQAPDGGSLQEVRHRIQAPADLGVDKLYSREEAAALGITLPEVQDEISGPALWRTLARQHGSLEGARDFLMSHGYDSAYYIDKDGKKAWAIWDQDAVGEHRAVERGGQAVDEAWVERAGEFRQKDRGKINVGLGSESTILDISLLNRANASTAAHEFGHAYLTMLQSLAAKPGATQQTKDDLQTIIDTYGEDGKITELAHERFADAHLLYLREGNAPSVALRSAFRRFSKWLADIWSDVKAGMADSGVVLTNDVRGVFDRIYATDMEIEIAKHDLAKPFATAEEAHMTESQFEVYQKTYASQIAEGKETMLAELMREMAAEQSAERKELLQRAYDRTLGEIDTLPEYRALATLVDGTVAKLSGESLRQMGIDPNTLGTEGIHRAWSNDPSAVDPDTAANLILDELGEQLFPDGVSLVRALTGLESRKGFARRLAQEEVAETFPNTLDDPEALRLLATESLEAGGEAYNRVKAKELRAIRQALRFAGKVAKDAVKAVTTEARLAGAEAAKMPDLAPFRIAAQQKVAGIVLGGTRDPLTGRAHDIGAALKGKAWEYLRTSRKAGGQSLKLMAKGRYAEAAQAKEREILTHFLYLETKKAQAEVKAFSILNKKLGSPGIQQKLGKAGGTFLDQIIKIRGRFSLSDQALEGFGPQRQTLAEWLEDNPDAEIDDRVMDETWSKPVERLTLDEMRAVRDAMTVIRTMAYQESTVLAEGRRVAAEQAEAELVASIAAGHDIKAHPLSESPELQKDKAANLLAGADAMLIKIEQLVNWMDGDRVDGPAHRYILQPFVDAQTKRYDMMAAVAVPLDEAFMKLPEEIRNGLGQRFDVSFVPDGLTRQQILSMAFNMGNDVNNMKLLEGYGWNESQVLEAMSHLTAQELAFVQESWDIVAGLWPDMVALEKRTVGVEPKKQEIAPLRVQLQDGSTVDLEGGYWPLKYDPDAPKNEAVQRKQNAADRLLNGSAAKPGTSRSAVKERTRYVGPLLLDFRSIMGGHLNDVIMDLSHREAINSVDKFIRRPKVKEAVQGAFGVKYYRQFEPWLKTIAGDGSSAAQHGLGDFSRAAMSMRSFMITAMLGYRYTSTIVQLADLGRVVAPGPYRVPVWRLASAFAQLVASRGKVIDDVRELSGEMQHRANNLDRDIRLIMNKRTGQQTLLDRFNRGGFKPFVWMDTLASVTTFLGKYQEKMEEHGDRDKAVKEAEQSVRALLQTGNPKDLIAVQRGHEAMKLLTMFMGDQVAGYNMMRNAGHRAKGLGGFAVQFAPTVMWISVLALFAEWLKGNWEDDERKRGKWIATKAAVAPFASIPVFSVAARYFENKTLDKFSRFNVTPAFGMIEKVIDTIDLTADMLGSEKHVDKVDYAIKAGDALGHALGIAGTSQATASTKYFVRLKRGQERPSNAAQGAYDFVRGKPKERP